MMNDKQSLVCKVMTCGVPNANLTIFPNSFCEDVLEPIYVEALVFCTSELFISSFVQTEEDAHKIGTLSAISVVESDTNSDAVKELLLRVMNEPSIDRIEYEKTNNVIISEFTFINMLIDANREAFDPMLSRMNQDILVRLRPIR